MRTKKMEKTKLEEEEEEIHEKENTTARGPKGT